MEKSRVFIPMRLARNSNRPVRWTGAIGRLSAAWEICRWPWSFRICQVAVTANLFSPRDSRARGAAFSPDALRVAFSFADGQQAIYTVDREGGDQRKLVDSPGICNWPSFSPDGRQLVFASTRDGNFEIYTSQADGSRAVRLTDNPRQDLRPRFSPDGRRVVFTSNRDGNYELYVMQADGSNLERLTNHPERDDYSAWHPDGRRIVAVCERSGRQDLYLLPAPAKNAK